MARDRSQSGWVEESGKKVKVWRGHFFVYVSDEEGNQVRKHRNVTLGPISQLRKWQAKKRLQEIIDREVGTGATRPSDSVTYGWFWKHRYLPLQTGWRDSTRAAVLFVMERHVLPRIGDKSLGSIERFELQSFLNELAGKYSKSLVDKARTWIRAVLSEAVEQDFLRRNPAGKLTMPPTRETCKRFLAPDEYHKVLGALHGRDRLIFRLFVLCALRPGELFALRWKCFSGDSLLIQEAVYRGKLGSPKTRGSAAAVILPKSLSVDLEQWYEDSGCPDPEDFIFPSTAGKPIDAHNYLQRDVLRPAAERVQVYGVTFQSLRRTFATHFHLVGTVKDQQSQMRHTNAQTTMNIYTQAVSESLRAAMETFDRKMSEGSEPNCTEKKKGRKRK